MKNKDNTKISIITPVLNGVGFLEKNILSIKNQNYSNFEHIIIDGGSNDGTIDIIKKYDGKYNMKWVSEKDTGIYNALNKGFDIATGDIFCWLDSDCFYLPNIFKKIVNEFAKNPKIDVVFGNILISDENGKIINYIKHTDFDLDVLIYFGMNVNPQATFWRKNIHYKLNNLDEKYSLSSDYDFFIRMGLSGSKFYHIKDFLSVFLFYSEQLTSKFKEKSTQESKEVADKYISKNAGFKKIKLKKVWIILKRFFLYIRQGDVFYVIRSILNRIGILNLKP